MWRTQQVSKGTVCLLQGRAEYIEKYFETISDLLDRGFSVLTFDWRGQGGSERLIGTQKGHVDRIDDYQTDLMTIIDQMMLPDCPPPYFAMAHSTGGLLLLRALMQGLRSFDRAFISSPLLRLKLSPTWRLVRRLSGTANALGLGSVGIPGGRKKIAEATAFAGNLLTTDPARLARNAAVIQQNHWLGTSVPTFGWLHAVSQGLNEIWAEGAPERLRTPILIVTGSRDMLVDSSAAEIFAKRIRTGGHVSIIGARHELMQERDQFREQWLATFDAFIPGSTQQI
jgi:lysophospholipase